MFLSFCILLDQIEISNNLGGHPFSTYANVSEKLTFLTS